MRTAPSSSSGSIPEVVILRLPSYVRILSQLQDEGVEIVSSRDLGERLSVTPAQIRKDLSYFGRFGKQGRGYDVAYLMEALREVLGLDREWNTAVVGVGRLGRAIINYPGFSPEGFKVIVAFDADPSTIGTEIGSVRVRSMAEMKPIIEELGIDIAIVAVPSPYAQDVINTIVGCGVKAILNYAPMAARVPEDVRVRNIDPVLALQTMTYHLKSVDARGEVR